VRRLALLLVPLLAACDPPCPTYWKEACAACGDESPGCKHAREAAERELKDAAKCSELSTSFAGLGSFAKKRYCEKWVNERRALDDIRGPWICGGVEVDFKGPATESKSSASPQQIVVNGAATTIYNVRTASFQVEGKLACEYHVGPHEMSVGEKGLVLRCPDAIGALPADKLLFCLQERKPDAKP
jgi:hypothetical protein